jgi:hypothetical protein
MTHTDMTNGHCTLCRLVRWKKEGPLSAQCVVGPYDIVVGGDIGIDRLVTDLENTPDAATDGQGPAIVLIGLPLDNQCGSNSAYTMAGG